MKRFYEEGRVDKELIEKYCLGDYEECKRYQLVEKGRFCPDPDCRQAGMCCRMGKLIED